MDRLSCLPDDVTCHILSFLPTQRSVQTSVLSKRWRFLWADVPSLVFDDNLDDRTLNIITQLLSQHNHDIHTFRLNGELETDDIEEFQSWIVNLTTRNIRNLVINIAGDHFCFPEVPRLFTCKTLVDLCLSGCSGVPLTGICFPALKKLKLKYVFYGTSQESGVSDSLANIQHLLSGCPVLEELSIKAAMLGHCCVSSPSLTSLVLQLVNADQFLGFGVELDTPGLRYLQLDSVMPDEFLIGSLDSLIEADIRLHWDEEYQDILVYSDNVLAFVAKLYNVKVLTILIDQIALSLDSAPFGLANKFHNLTKLDLDVHSNFGLITSFLENADNLRFLCLSIEHWNVPDDDRYWMEPKQVPSCLTSHLQTVDIYDFGCSLDEFDMVRYILMNAQVLKRMEIRTRLAEHDWKRKTEAVKRVALFERGSRECQLVVY